MKRRAGFVSNSSSSSFIISKKEDKELKVMVEMDLSKCVDKKLKTKKEVDEYILDRYGWNCTLQEVLDDEEYVAEIYHEMLAAIDRGEVVYELSGSSEDYAGPGSYLYYTGTLKGFEDLTVIRDGD